MALRFIDSFDHYTAAQMEMKWTTASYNNIQAGLHGSGARGVFTKGMLFPGNTIIMECYIYRINIPSTIFALHDVNANQQISCDFNFAGAVEVSQWAGGRLFQSTPDRIRTGTWYHFGWKVYIHPSAGTVEVRLNGEVLCSLTGICTTNGLFQSNPNPAYWSGTLGIFSLGDNANACVFDDLVVMDNVADGINDPRLTGSGGYTKFLGPVLIKVKRPNGAGFSADWTGVPTTPNWDNVNDLTEDADATYNNAVAAQINAVDLFTMEDLLPGEDVLAVQSLVLARKTDDGVAAVAKVVRDGSTTSQGATVYQPNSYSYMHAPEPTLPDGSLWSAARWNAIQYGYKRVL